MSRSGNSKPVGARKIISRPQSAKKRVRRVIFKSDEWYAGAAMSIGIAGRAKAARPMPPFSERLQEKAEAD
jgi:hypothetical protein